MATKSIDFKEFQSLYETCSSARDLKEFCKDSGVNYDKFIEWQRKQLRNEKLGRNNSRMVPIAVVDSPINTDSRQQTMTSPVTIRFVEVKFSDGVSIRRFNVSVEDLVLQLNKLSGVLC